MGEKTFRVEGMHCEHCKARVEEAVNGIHGAAGRADWKKGLLTVLYSQPVDDGQIKQRLEKAGLPGLPGFCDLRRPSSALPRRLQRSVRHRRGQPLYSRGS